MIFLLIILNLFSSSLSSNGLPPPCSSEIYCYGELIDTVMKMRIYHDSKTFVDLRLKNPPNETIIAFHDFMEISNNTPTIDQVKVWLENHFNPAGSELTPYIPEDFNEKPTFLEGITDKKFKKFASDLNRIWINLCRKIIDEVKDHPELSSIIYVPGRFIIAGGRFHEFYYWDSYWIIRGLLVCELFQTVRSMIHNFLTIIEQYGFIPNGGRIYYLARSQPPLLSGMMKSYIDRTHDYEFAISSVDLLEKEFNYFITKKTVIVKGHRLARYIDESSGPRPESYREDSSIGNEFDTDEERENFYSEIKAAGESGMDFSSRWFINKNGENIGTLKDLKTRHIIPVELNAILYWNARIISEIFEYAKNTVKQKEYEMKANEILKAVNEVLWNEELGIWTDYDLINNKSRPYFSPTNFAPLWTKCFDATKSLVIADKIVAYIKNLRLDDYPGGIPNSLYSTGEQWDWPNSWAPMQHMIILGLDNLEDSRTSSLAITWAERWIQSNFIAFEKTGNMYEKYIATELGGFGGGGEYEVQTGFGWSNGVILDLLDKYGQNVKSPGSYASQILIDIKLYFVILVIKQIV
ncbi:hypothetical protein ACKWTF_007471 [Chironomus riparius]